MKTIATLSALMTILSIYCSVAQNGPVLGTNQEKIMTLTKFTIEERYIVNENEEMKKEALELIGLSVNTFNEVNEVRTIALSCKKYEDLYSKVVKKADKLEYIALSARFDAAEYIELSNDMTFSLYQKVFERITTHSEKNIPERAKNMMKEAEKQYNNSKSKIDECYNNGFNHRTVELLFDCQKNIELAIKKQEKAFSNLLDFEYKEEELWIAMVDISTRLTAPEDVAMEQINLTVNNELTAEAQIEDQSSIDVKELETESKTETQSESEPVKTYKVQIGAFISEVDQKAFNGINPIAIEESETGFTRYLVGDYNSVAVACHSLKILKDTGFDDAFIVTYINGDRQKAVIMRETIINDNSSAVATK
ncbi:MAG: hypothetical protein A2W91_05880 [Bacteroidetes bacterium GWF2_38_335]|nr:MAG: hypothetical protein A2W91_05880 [Bacteroidetes bacterium GWF2_38_335]OFY81605.1 MAG: hypothetical protein A2281_11675 [Bacteroidetes bacterium RIFOXYA12_FULL_38_20]HBS88955.1 hypothetical protein [Bacteroidales bacterium]